MNQLLWITDGILSAIFLINLGWILLSIFKARKKKNKQLQYVHEIFKDGVQK